MEQMNQFRWAQDHINKLSEQDADTRHALQQRMRAVEASIDELERNSSNAPTAERRFAVLIRPGENRAQRRERERKERRAEKRAAKVKA